MRTMRKTSRSKTLNRIGRALAITILMMTIVIPLLVVTTTGNDHARPSPAATTTATTASQQPKTSSQAPPPTPTPIKEWSYATGGSVDSSPCVADVDGDGLLEVIVGSRDRKVYCLSRTGSFEWSYTTGGSVESSPAVADVDGDSQLEVLVGSNDNKVYCLNVTGGTPKVQWSNTTGGSVHSSPAVADVDGDSQLEVLVGSNDNKVYCLSKTGSFEWNYTTGGWVYSSPVVADVDGDGLLEVIVGSIDNKVYCLNVTGGTPKVQWSRSPGGGSFHSSPVVADVDGDGQLEVIVGSETSRVYCLSGKGDKEWEFYEGPGWRVQSSPAVADVDGDSELEVLVGSRDRNVYCINGNSSPPLGFREWYYRTGGIVNSSVVVADIDGDRQLEVIVGSQDNRVYCLSVVGAPYDVGAYPWPSIGFHGDIQHTGFFNDSDRDGLTDSYEAVVGTEPSVADTDGDTASDYMEFLSSTNPFVDTVPPATITNLATSSVTSSSITLTWTAPGDNGATGTATGYVVKYSAAGATTSANWSSATEYAQSWLPSEAGGGESHEVSPLAGDTQYWFAVEAYDETPNCGGVSNSPSGKTSDTMAPSAITDLVVIGVVDDNVTLSWTAPGDNGNTGTVASYLVRYSTSEVINDGNWGSAIPYSQSWTPRAGGSAEVHTITGLSHDTIYWFAIKAYDEVPYYGDISNSPNATTTDIVAPGAVTDLAVVSRELDSITLTWTAPGDNGATGTAKGYWVKYSTAGPISDANWGSATNYTQSWVPRSGGDAEVHTITGLSSNTTYCFAIKAVDEVQHYGGISNSPSGTTTAPPPSAPAGASQATAVVGLGVGTAGIVLAVVALVFSMAKKRR